MAQQSQTDTDALMAEESFGLNEILDELRDVHGDPVAENENMIVFADTHGYELNDIADHTEGVDYSDVSGWMHKTARTIRDRVPSGGDHWAVYDPVVVLKWNEGENPYLNEQ